MQVEGRKVHYHIKPNKLIDEEDLRQEILAKFGKQQAYNIKFFQQSKKNKNIIIQLETIQNLELQFKVFNPVKNLKPITFLLHQLTNAQKISNYASSMIVLTDQSIQPSALQAQISKKIIDIEYIRYKSINFGKNKTKYLWHFGDNNKKIIQIYGIVGNKLINFCLNTKIYIPNDDLLIYWSTAAQNFFQNSMLKQEEKFKDYRILNLPQKKIYQLFDKFISKQGKQNVLQFIKSNLNNEHQVNNSGEIVILYQKNSNDLVQKFKKMMYQKHLIDLTKNNRISKDTCDSIIMQRIYVYVNPNLVQIYFKLFNQEFHAYDKFTVQMITHNILVKCQQSHLIQELDSRQYFRYNPEIQNIQVFQYTNIYAVYLQLVKKQFRVQFK